MTRFQGRSAEKAFSKLCSDSGVTCNDSVEDDNGWDHIVEFPHIPSPQISADMQRQTPAVFVQTKSHSASGGKVSMKLSNAVKLARSDSPAFVILRTSPKANDSGEPFWHAIHFWDPLIARTLKRAREASRDGISADNFHKLSLSFTMTEANRRTDSELLAWIESTVLSAGNDYAAAKRALCPPHQIVGTMSFGPLESMEQLVDHLLGLTQDIPVTAFTLRQRRFDIDLPFPTPVPTGTPVRATIHPNPAEQCDIWMRGPDGSSIEVAADIIVPGLPNLPGDQQKVRIRAPMFDIVSSLSGDATLTVHFDPSAKWTPTELGKIVRFLSWSHEGEIDLRVTVRDEPLLLGNARFDGINNQEMFGKLAKQVEMLARLSVHLKTKLPQISVADFKEAENVISLYHFMHGTDIKFGIKLFKDQPFSEIDEAVVSAAASVGDWIFAVIQRFPIIHHQRNRDRVTLAFGVPIILQTYAFEENDVAALEQLKADFERHICKRRVIGISNALSLIDELEGALPRANESI
jgi:hypothetical protein